MCVYGGQMSGQIRGGVHTQTLEKGEGRRVGKEGKEELLLLENQLKVTPAVWWWEQNSNSSPGLQRREF